MGTRGLVVIQNEEGEEILTVYCQSDCYPEGMGSNLKNILGKMRLVDGIPIGTRKNCEAIANGMGCLAAQIVMALKGQRCMMIEFKNGKPVEIPASPIGEVYIFSPGTRDVGERYIYTIFYNEISASGIGIRVESPHLETRYKGKLGHVLYEGSVAGMKINEISKRTDPEEEELLDPEKDPEEYTKALIKKRKQ